MFGGMADRDAEVLEDGALKTAGSVVMGRRTFDVGEGRWGDDPCHVPCFVLSHEPREKLTKGSATFTFVTESVESALDQARAAADDRDVLVMGGANAAQQFMNAGLVDEMRIHLGPVLLGDGIRLFEHHGIEQVELDEPRSSRPPAPLTSGSASHGRKRGSSFLRRLAGLSTPALARFSALTPIMNTPPMDATVLR